jgi:hypothetical protein
MTAYAMHVPGMPLQPTAHVSCEVEDVLAALDNLLAVVVDAQVHQMELIAEDLLLRRPACPISRLLLAPES